MFMKNIFKLLLLILILVLPFLLKNIIEKTSDNDFVTNNNRQLIKDSVDDHPLQIVSMREKEYPGSNLLIEKTLPKGNGYDKYIVAYFSEGLKINGLLAIPDGERPKTGWPAIVFNHGYIKPEEYERELKYVSYIAGFASRGFVVFMPDYRGHQDSEGEPLGAYFSPAYTTDSLNAFYSLAKHPDVDRNRIGMWGHSMGGHITLRSMVISKDIKAGVIWAGVVASYEEMSTGWRRSEHWSPSSRENMSNRPGRTDLEETFGNVTENTEFWRSISPIYFVKDISGPLQLHHGLSDQTVPWEFSESLKNALEKNNKTVEYYTYKNADHNLSGEAFSPAMARSVEFFKANLE